MLSDLSSDDSVSLDKTSEDEEYIQGRPKAKKAPRPNAFLKRTGEHNDHQTTDEPNNFQASP